MAQANNKDRRAQRLRTRIKKVANGRPRLSVFRSAKNISAQVIDDVSGRTLAAASSLEKGVASGAKSEEAARIGALIAERAKQAGVTAVVFDRGAYLYHGRVKALAEAARAGGLEF